MKIAAITALSLAAAAGVAQAQNQRPASPPVTAAPPAPAPSAQRAQVSVQPLQPEQRPPQLAKTEVAYYDNWQTSCQEFVNPARRQCASVLQLVQTNQQTNSATVLVTWGLAQGEQQLNATIQTPTGILIAPGIELKIGKTTKKLSYGRCDAQRCEAAFPVDEALSKELSAAESVELVIVAIQGNAITFNIPIKGYEKAAQALKR
jgi:invasion protein IalB